MDIEPAAPARLLYQAGERRSFYVRYLLRAFLGVLAAIALALAVTAVAERGTLSPLFANIALLVAIIFGLWFAIRLVIQCVRLITRRTVTVRLYDKGFVWFDAKRAARHRWSEVVRFREGVHAVRLFGRPILEWGSHVLTTEDGNEYRFSPALGDADVFAAYVRPYAAYVTSLRMGKALRREMPVKLSDSLVIYPGGVEIKRVEVPWAELRVTVDSDWREITLRRVQPGKKPKLLSRMGTTNLDNAAGFIEIARPQIESHSQRLE